MVKELSKEEIVRFIEQYGDGDIYFSHYFSTDGKLIIKYLSKLTHFVDELSIDAFKKELKENPHLKEKYLSEIILTDNFAYITTSDTSDKNILVRNFKKFLKDLKSKKYSQKSESARSAKLKEGATPQSVHNGEKKKGSSKSKKGKESKFDDFDQEELAYKKSRSKKSKHKDFEK